ncbi:glutathione synthase [Pleurocapsa sp. CCALA 161]|uniref:glutathione synthase n=1 Tax=Pleurocapsa sp. CCALA 161 TaxID=2107688 RepID=UPI000D06CF0C|nr:glutathione synthase [Pleurocapsa sp. CCALA 161]PSB12101.1 glutathione synthase [Pleurocapsa sp. CCALA 161]
MKQYPEADISSAVDLALACALLQRTQTGDLTHCPLMLSPAIITNLLITQLESLAQPLALLIHRVANDLDFLVEQLQFTAASDEYTGFLLSLAQEQRRQDSLRFSLTRSDYFMTQTDGLRQVEFNTIAASYIGLSEKITEFHKIWGNLQKETWDLLPNQPIAAVADAFVTVMKEYNVLNACVLFVVQANERNVFDQRLLEIALIERGIKVVRASLEAIGEQGEVRQGHLLLNGEIAAITYFRAGYRPDELESKIARQGRQLIARSTTVSVPDLPTHLAGTKKIQQVLTNPQLLKLFLDEEDIAIVRTAFAQIYTLDVQIKFEGKMMLAKEAAILQPEQFVLKPQREGGGFNLYGEDLRQCLQNLPAEAGNAYILMERLYPPVSPGWGLRDGKLWQGQVVHEIGQYGILIAHGDRILTNQAAGYLVRTKLGEMNEGGISAGYGHLNSLVKSNT